MPAGGSVSAAAAIHMVYDLVALSVGTLDRDDDTDGTSTVNYLIRSRQVMRLVLSNDPSSLGLHPAVYFYSWTGKQIPTMLLCITEFVVKLEKTGRLLTFTKHRSEFEKFLIANRALLNQVIRKFGATPSGRRHLLGFYEDVFAQIIRGLEAENVVEKLRAGGSYSYLQPQESPYEGVAPTRFSTQVKSGVVIQELLGAAKPCPICNCLIPTQAISVDHRIRRADGGIAIADNGQLTHPFCNTGFKEAQTHLRRKMDEARLV